MRLKKINMSVQNPSKLYMEDELMRMFDESLKEEDNDENKEK